MWPMRKKRGREGMHARLLFTLGQDESKESLRAPPSRLEPPFVDLSLSLSLCSSSSSSSMSDETSSSSDATSSIHYEVAANKQTLASHLLYQSSLLLWGAVLEELLYDVVAEHVRHEAVGRGHDL